MLIGVVSHDGTVRIEKAELLARRQQQTLLSRVPTSCPRQQPLPLPLQSAVKCSCHDSSRSCRRRRSSAGAARTAACRRSTSFSAASSAGRSVGAEGQEL